MDFNVGIINKVSFLYLLLSLLIFICGWFNPFFMTISVIALFFIIKSILQDKSYNDKTFFLEKDYIFIIVLISAIWCYLAGIGGYFWQVDPDWHVRNAIMNDLSEFSFPVIYENNTALVYNFGFMLFPASITKIFKFFDSSGDLTFIISNAATYIWVLGGILLLMLHVINLTKAEKIKSVVAVLIFVFFSGMDLFAFGTQHYSNFHIDWHYPYSYLCNSNMLNYTYHIALPVWLTISLFMQYRENIAYYGILMLFLVFFCPFSAIGFLPYVLIMGFAVLILNRKNIKFFITSLFDIKNLLSIFVIFLPIILFFKSNYTSSQYEFYTQVINSSYFSIFMLEVGIYALIIFVQNRKNLGYYITVMMLLILPMICYYSNHDFALKSTIPYLFILSILVIKFLLSDELNIKFNKYVLCIMLLLGAVTPICQYCNNFYYNNTMPEYRIKNSIYTFNNKIDENIGWENISDNRNYASINYKQYPFWQYVAKHLEEN